MASDPLSQRFIGQSVDRWNKGEQHSMDRQRIDTKDLFGGTRGNDQFGKKEYGKKKFGRKAFATNKEYQSPDYQFIRDREMAREEAAVASERFHGAEQTANEGRKRWFGRKKDVSRDTAYEAGRIADDGGRSIDREGYRDAAASQDLNRKKDLDIVNPAGSEAAPKVMSIQDIKQLIGN